MSRSQTNPDIVSERHIFTQYPVEEFTFTWKVTNFSKIFSLVDVQFKTFSCATVWKLRMTQSYISLYKCYEGDTIKVHFKCSLFTNSRTLENEGNMEFYYESDHCLLMDMHGLGIRFENDVFNFKCTLNILGHTLTNEIKSAGSEATNFKQLSCDMRDLFEKQENCDFTMIVGQNKIQVHKLILCARSPVFNKMFQYQMLETESNEMQIYDIDFDVLNDLLIFMYSGELKELNWNKALQLYYAADKYEIISLRETCSEYLQLNLEVDNVCDLLKLASMHQDGKLKESAVIYAQMHSFALKSTANWQELLKTHPRLAVEIFK